MAQDTLLGFPAHTLPYRRGEFTTLSTASVPAYYVRRDFPIWRDFFLRQFSLTGVELVVAAVLGQQILVLIVQNEFSHDIVGTVTAANSFFRQIGSTLGASLVGALFTSRLSADLAAQLPRVDNINVNRITPEFVQHLAEPVRHAIATAYSDALVPIFLYVVPLLAVGFVFMLTLKEHPLATKVDHAGHPGDEV